MYNKETVIQDAKYCVVQVNTTDVSRDQIQEKDLEEWQDFVHKDSSIGDIKIAKDNITRNINKHQTLDRTLETSEDYQV